MFIILFTNIVYLYTYLFNIHELFVNPKIIKRTTNMNKFINKLMNNNKIRSYSIGLIGG